ncbi:unnamed protein product [Orchesella dallaii]|uniref:F-box domain-containing protein n=1 Tax=Orchesella dallaii TaxID=48710 RepID=A0ABP1RGD6_9HEXA
MRNPKHLELLEFYIPPELVDKILVCITEHNTLLRCRLVCSKWKRFTDEILEKHHLSSLTQWNFDSNLKYPSLSPPIFVYRERSGTKWTDLLAVLPSALRGTKLWSPFPQNYLAIIGFQESHKNDENMSCPQVQLKPTVQTQEKNNLAIPTNLKHLEILNCDEYLTESVVPLFSQQLVSLKIGGLDYEGSLALGNSVNLKQLFIHEINVMEFEELINDAKALPQLEYLSVIMSSQNVFWQEKHKILNCLSKVSESLTHLRLKVEVEVFQRLLNEYAVIFSNVSFLEIACSTPNIHEESLKENLLPWFPKLKSVSVKSIPQKRFLQDRECLLCGEIGPEFNPARLNLL